MPCRSRSLVALIILMSLVRPMTASDDPQRAFTKRWEGKQVVVKQSLFTLVYDERNRIGHYSRKRDGLIVVGGSGAHLQFNGRDSESDIIEQDPDRLADVVRNTYIRSLDLDIGSYRKVEPIVVQRYDSGTSLVVRDVRLEEKTVTLLFTDPDGLRGEIATALTVTWPVPLSRRFAEAPLVENLIRQFVDLRDDSPGSQARKR
jgi:hypothetical protein